jgi:hypothetical protein
MYGNRSTGDFRTYADRLHARFEKSTPPDAEMLAARLYAMSLRPASDPALLAA